MILNLISLSLSDWLLFQLSESREENFVSSARAKQHPISRTQVVASSASRRTRKINLRSNEAVMICTSILFCAELKLPGYYLEHVFYLDFGSCHFYKYEQIKTNKRNARYALITSVGSMFCKPFCLVRLVFFLLVLFFIFILIICALFHEVQDIFAVDLQLFWNLFFLDPLGEPEIKNNIKRMSRENPRFFKTGSR